MKPRRRMPDDGVRRNELIHAREVRVIGMDGEQLGIMSGAAAMQIAIEKDLDLVKIAPGSNPPVCKIMDYGKYRRRRQNLRHILTKKAPGRKMRLGQPTVVDSANLKAVRRLLPNG